MSRSSHCQLRCFVGAPGYMPRSNFKIGGYTTDPLTGERASINGVTDKTIVIKVYGDSEKPARSATYLIRDWVRYRSISVRCLARVLVLESFPRDGSVLARKSQAIAKLLSHPDAAIRLWQVVGPQRDSGKVAPEGPMLRVLEVVTHKQMKAFYEYGMDRSGNTFAGPARVGNGVVASGNREVVCG